MTRTLADRRFISIGEKLHATRTLLRSGRHVRRAASGDMVAFAGRDGASQEMPLAAPVAAGSDLAAGRVKHVRNALLLGLGGDEAAPVALTGPVTAGAAAMGRAYLVAVAHRQEDAGAAYLDVNIDEIAGDETIRAATMAWLVRLLEDHVRVPLALDSSSAAVIRAGLAASRAPAGPVLLNSASVERLDVLDLAAERGLPVVVGADGEGGLPQSADARLANATRILDLAVARGIAANRIFMDLLVLPVGVDPDAGSAFLDAARRFRAGADPAIHLTGGLSNVSFGLPNRSLLNDVFVALAMDAGVDSGIVDPVATDPVRISAMDRESPAFRLAAAVLTGEDEYAAAYLAAFRAGRLSASRGDAAG